MILYVSMQVLSRDSLFPEDDGEGGSENGDFSIDYCFASATSTFVAKILF